MKNPENIYELLNDLSIDFDSYEKEELSELEKRKMKKTLKIKKKGINTGRW